MPNLYLVCLKHDAWGSWVSQYVVLAAIDHRHASISWYFQWFPGLTVLVTSLGTLTMSQKQLKQWAAGLGHVNCYLCISHYQIPAAPCLWKIPPLPKPLFCHLYCVLTLQQSSFSRFWEHQRSQSRKAVTRMTKTPFRTLRPKFEGGHVYVSLSSYDSHNHLILNTQIHISHTHNFMCFSVYVNINVHVNI